MSSFPCTTCTALCCGPVPLSADRLATIKAYIASFSPKRLRRLRAQRRGFLTCKFLDTADHTCSIYEVRPTVCTQFGRVPRMICPKVGHVVEPLVQIVADMSLDKDTRGIVLFSDDFQWP